MALLLKPHLLLRAACLIFAWIVSACGGGGGGSSTNTNTFTSNLSLSSSLGSTMTATYTCDGTGSSPDLSWSNAPSGTTEFALLMSTVAPDQTKYNWVLYNIPAGTTQLKVNSFGIGSTGIGDDGNYAGYQAPCSSGSGDKTYTFTLYALSSSPNVSTPVSGAALKTALTNITLSSASLSMTYNAPGASGNGHSTACVYLQNSARSSQFGTASVSCDGTYGYISSNGLATHTMMNGITGTNLQVPVAQNFLGSNGWKIPLAPAIAASTTNVIDGPLGVAINGVPIFNPCKQGGCITGGDTKALGELDICNGHAGRADDYHYHAAPTCLMAGQSASYWDTHPIGWALDGFAIFGYNDPNGSTASRDNICGGNTTANTNAPTGYAYHVTDTSPYIASCLRGTPSPDLAGQTAKYTTLRRPPVDPLPTVSGMTLTTNGSGYSVLQFTAASSFNTTPDNSTSYSTINPAGTYKILYKAITGSALTTELARSANSGKTACWEFIFQTNAGSSSQPSMNFCK
jgi:phosphatidylethanolamine-binding protein (PEBP) family uncharacterized protein